MKNILIVDDHPLVIAALSGSLSCLGRVHGTTTAVDAMRLARAIAMDLAFVDVNLGGADGIELTRRLLREPVPARVVVMSDSRTSIYSWRARRAGAWGCLSKTEQLPDIARSAGMVLAGYQLFPPDESPIARQGRDPQWFDRLSDREMALLRLLVECTPPSIIGKKLSISAKTVSGNKIRIMRKLGASSLVELVDLARAHGIE
jgi:two-component system response regulator EvgA